jgi:hypothetical protein
VLAYAVDEALENVRSTSGGAYAPPFVAPAYERPVDALASWHDRYTAFNQLRRGPAGAATRTALVAPAPTSHHLQMQATCT